MKIKMKINFGIIRDKLKGIMSYLQMPLTGEISSVGLDIGTKYIKLAKVKKTPRGYIVEKCGVVEIPPEVIVDREVMDRGMVIDCLNKLIKDCDVEGSKVSTLLSGKDVILKRIETKPVKKKEYKSFIEKTIKDSLAVDMKEMVVDVKKLIETKDSLHLLLSCAKNEAIYSWLDIIKEVNLLPYNIDVISSALQAVYEANNYITKEGSYIIINIGYEHTFVLGISNGEYIYETELPMGTRAFVEELVRSYAISLSDADDVLMGKKPEIIEEKEFNKIINLLLSRLFTRIKRTLPELKELKSIILTGGGSAIPRIDAFFSEKFGIPCVIGEPLKNIKCVIKPSAPTQSFDIAIGLAIAKLESRYVNLIPKEERLKERNRLVEALDLHMPFYATVITGLILGLVIFNLDKKEKRTAFEINDMARRQHELAPKVKEVKELMEKEKEISTKVKVLSELSKPRYARIKLLDEINMLLPNYTWLVEVRELSVDTLGGINIIIKGITTTNYSVSNFMESLRVSKYFSNVELSYTKSGKIGDVETTEFELHAKFKEEVK